MEPLNDTNRSPVSQKIAATNIVIENIKYVRNIQPSEQPVSEPNVIMKTIVMSRVQNTLARIEQNAGIENSSPATRQYRFQNVR
jgi:hypothetical protein